MTAPATQKITMTPLSIVVPSLRHDLCGVALFGSSCCMLNPPAKRTQMHFGHTQYLPIALPLFALLAGALALLLILVPGGHYVKLLRSNIHSGAR